MAGGRAKAANVKQSPLNDSSVEGSSSDDGLSLTGLSVESPSNEPAPPPRSHPLMKPKQLFVEVSVPAPRPSEWPPRPITHIAVPRPY